MNSDQSDARKRLHEQLAAEVSAEVSQQDTLPDTDQVEQIIQEAIARGDVGLNATAAIPYDDRRRGYEKASGVFIEPRVLAEFIAGSIERALTPPPAPSEPWSVISTDRDKPTLARVTLDYGDHGETITDFWWRTGDKGLIAGHHGVYESTHVTDVELLHTHNPETHVPVERALIDEAAGFVTNWDTGESNGAGRVVGFMRDLASLASDESSDTDGGRS